MAALRLAGSVNHLFNLYLVIIPLDSVAVWLEEFGDLLLCEIEERKKNREGLGETQHCLHWARTPVLRFLTVLLFGMWETDKTLNAFIVNSTFIFILITKVLYRTGRSITNLP